MEFNALDVVIAATSSGGHTQNISPGIMHQVVTDGMLVPNPHFGLQQGPCKKDV